jgi:hypothetical protein
MNHKTLRVESVSLFEGESPTNLNFILTNIGNPNNGFAGAVF